MMKIPQHTILFSLVGLFGHLIGQLANTQIINLNFVMLINLAKAKLLGSTYSWDKGKFNSQWKRTVTLALIACTAALYVSPASSIAPELVRAHMATLIAIDK